VEDGQLTVRHTQQWLELYGQEVFEHADLVSSDFHLFEPLERHLSGQHFVNNVDIVAMRTLLEALYQDFFVKSWNALVFCSMKSLKMAEIT
jgi:hypothetical protein